MPDREIPEEKLRQIKDWVYETKDGVHVRNLLPGQDNGIWSVDGEPFVIYSTGAWNPQVGAVNSSTHLFCTERHALELEQAGVINFSEQQILDKPE